MSIIFTMRTHFKWRHTVRAAYLPGLKLSFRRTKLSAYLRALAVAMPSRVRNIKSVPLRYALLGDVRGPEFLAFF